MSPPVSGVGPGCSWTGLIPSSSFVREILKELVASGSRIPCAALVGKYNPYPPRNTEFSVNRKATPRRGAKLFLSVPTSPPDTQAGLRCRYHRQCGRDDRIEILHCLVGGNE